jgi:catechol 2,3-dioxygenase-like lactoylglutathione lyase family enzyme
MRLGYVIVYTPDPTRSVEFFEKAFGLRRRFIHESGYAEMETGQTALAFATHGLGESNLPAGYVRADGAKPLGMEIALVTEDVGSAYSLALAAGAEAIKAPTEKPWGQTVAYVRAPDGTLVELCSAISG